MLRRTDIGVEEEFAGIGVWPVFGDDEFGFLVVFRIVNKSFEGFVFADESEGGLGTDFWNGVKIITAKEDTEVDELEIISYTSYV